MRTVVREDRAVTPATEWLLDNFYVAQEQIRQVHEDLPRGFYRGLPKLADGPLEGYPRVFGLAWALVAHADSRFDRQLLVRFVGAYQRVQPLTIGELWAVPITLRVVLIENLRRSAERIANGRAAYLKADALADPLLGVGGRAAEPPETALRRFNSTPLPPAFVVRLLQRLRDQDPRVTPALLWLDERLAGTGTTADAIVREEHRRQRGMNVTVRNVITSMRLISTLDWAEIFESVSLVDAALRAAGCFAQMDFLTRDRYRHAIEDLARGSGRSELDVARRAIAAATPPIVGPAEPLDRALAASRTRAITSSRTAVRPSRRSWACASRSPTGSRGRSLGPESSATSVRSRSPPCSSWVSRCWRCPRSESATTAGSSSSRRPPVARRGPSRKAAADSTRASGWRDMSESDAALRDLPAHVTAWVW